MTGQEDSDKSAPKGRKLAASIRGWNRASNEGASSNSSGTLAEAQAVQNEQQTQPAFLMPAVQPWGFRLPPLAFEDNPPSDQPPTVQTVQNEQPIQHEFVLPIGTAPAFPRSPCLPPRSDENTSFRDQQPAMSENAQGKQKASHSIQHDDERARKRQRRAELASYYNSPRSREEISTHNELRKQADELIAHLELIAKNQDHILEIQERILEIQDRIIGHRERLFQLRTLQTAHKKRFNELEQRTMLNHWRLNELTERVDTGFRRRNNPAEWYSEKLESVLIIEQAGVIRDFEAEMDRLSEDIQAWTATRDGFDREIQSEQRRIDQDQQALLAEVQALRAVRNSIVARVAQPNLAAHAAAQDNVQHISTLTSDNETVGGSENSDIDMED